MSRPYSMDLRERAVARVLAGESVRSVAAVLSISAATVVRWSGRHRATGSARRREQWKKYQGRLDPRRLVFIDETCLS